MTRVPALVAEFLAAKNIAVAGVSRDSRQPANAIFRRLAETGHAALAINPKAGEVEGQHSYPDLKSVPGPIDAVMIVTHPAVSADVVRQAAERGIGLVWFHRSFGTGSVSPEALGECAARGVRPIVGGCPLMYCGSVDVAHKCMRWLLDWQGRVPQ